jgi:hypothetical protein
MIRRFHSAAKPQPNCLSNLMIPVARLGVSLRDRRATQGRAARPGPPSHALLGRKMLPEAYSS